MKAISKATQSMAIIVLLMTFSACSDKPEVSKAPVSSEASIGKIPLTVYKSPSCGCCGNWIDHVEASGFEASINHPDDLNQIKIEKGISPRYQACHTAVSKEGYVFEGHIPSETMQRFLANPPANAIGLAVPGMPIGSPGMEMGSRIDSYDVVLLSKDGSGTVYEHISGNN